jgi:hypothetical protein
MAFRALFFTAAGLFLGGFVALGGAFFVFSPSIFETPTCCGPGTDKSRTVS